MDEIVSFSLDPSSPKRTISRHLCIFPTPTRSTSVPLGFLLLRVCASRPFLFSARAENTLSERGLRPSESKGLGARSPLFVGSIGSKKFSTKNVLNERVFTSFWKDGPIDLVCLPTARAMKREQHNFTPWRRAIRHSSRVESTCYSTHHTNASTLNSDEGRGQLRKASVSR